MFVPQEMCALQEPVARQDRLVPRLRPEQSGIVTDAQRDGASAQLARRALRRTCYPAQNAVLVLKLAFHGFIRTLPLV
jgi:hypothetical protein